MAQMFDAVMLTELVSNIPTRVTAVLALADHLYLGTSDGQLMHYTFERTSPQLPPKSVFIERKRALPAGKKAVEAIVGTDDGPRVITVFSQEGFVDVFDSRTLEVMHSAQVKGATGLVLDKSRSRAAHRFAVWSKKKVTLYDWQSGKCEQRKELELEKGAVCVEYAGNHLFLGTKKAYVMVDVESGAHSQVAVPLAEKVEPYVRFLDAEHGVVLRYERTGFVLDHTGAMRQNAKYTWSAEPTALSYVFPFLLSLQPGRVEVHSVTDQVLLQTVPLPDGFSLLGEGAHACVAGGARVAALFTKGVDDLLHDLLRVTRVAEATALFTKSSKETGAALTAKLRHFNAMVGTSLMHSIQFQRAFDHFLGSDMPLTAVLAFYPGVLPKAALTEALAQSEKVEQLVRRFLGGGMTGDKADKALARYRDEANAQLISYLERLRTKRATLPDADTRLLDLALTKLYVITQSEGLAQWFTTPGVQVSVDDLHAWAEEERYLAALASFYVSRKQERKALEIWGRIGQRQVRDRWGHDGVADAVRLLSSTPDVSLVWEFAGWVVEAMGDAAVAIFTAPRTPPLAPDKVLEFLRKYPSNVSQAYLEALIEKGQLMDERYHTLLASMYIDTIVALLPPGGVPPAEAPPAADPRGRPSRAETGGLLGRTRRKLKLFLIHSALYNPTPLLARTRDTGLQEENVLLLGKLGQHQQALSILVEQMHDLSGAEEYCVRHHADDNDLFFWLFKVYAAAEPADGAALNDRALALLRRHAAYLPPAKVLPTLPPTFPLAELQDYLVRALQSNVSAARETMALRSIRRAESMNAKCRAAELKARRVVINKERMCAVCHKRISDQVFAFYPNGVVVHFKCAKDKHTDPVSGRDFRQHPLL